MGMNAIPSSGALAVDIQSLGSLKHEAATNNPQALRETAKQFESLFMRELMKSMREATMKSGLLDNAGSALGTDLLDQQFSVQMSGQPGGFSDLIVQQLSRQKAAKEAANTSTSTGPATTDKVGAATPARIDAAAGTGRSAEPTRSTTGVERAQGRTQRPPTESQTQFVRQHSRVAADVERATGIPASFMLGQAGHETGWGKFEIKHKGGAPSYNLFGIKAGPNWNGKVAEVTTTEYVDGVAQKKVARFRAYDSYADAFRDYASLISDSPRYAKIRHLTGSAQEFASGLQKAGYATDPEYAAKLSRAINTTLAIRRVQV